MVHLFIRILRTITRISSLKDYRSGISDISRKKRKATKIGLLTNAWGTDLLDLNTQNKKFLWPHAL